MFRYKNAKINQQKKYMIYYQTNQKFNKMVKAVVVKAANREKIQGQDKEIIQVMEDK